MPLAETVEFASSLPLGLGWKVRHADDREFAQEFVRTYHYTHHCKSSVRPYGLYLGRALLGVAAFNTTSHVSARAMVFGERHSSRVYELVRLVLMPGLPTCTASWFVPRALQALKHDLPDLWAVLSYADSGENHRGTIYQATNAIYFGRSTAWNVYKDANGTLHSRIAGALTITPQMAFEMGWTHVRKTYKHRYLFLLAGDRRERRRLQALLKITPQPYPKEP